VTPFPNGAQAIKRVTPFSQTQFTVENRISKSPISLFVIAVDIRDFENIPGDSVSLVSSAGGAQFVDLILEDSK